MFCPRCSNQIAENQNYCRNCGLKLHLIVDAIQDKPSRGQFDFETLKRDLRDLGSSLRAGFEEAIKNTRKLNKNAPPASQQDGSREISKAVWSHEVNEVFKHHIGKALKKVKAAHTRKYSFQQAALSIFGGGATMAVWYYVLEAAVDSGLLQNLELIIAGKIDAPVVGLVPVIRMLWMLGLIPVTRGVAHLINGIFFAPKPEKEPEPQTGFSPDFASTPAQNRIQSPPAFVSAVADPAT
ncbi:MAG TPA: zinc ribbon domain-containing protein, partial [Blastocatellia bacterium]|nr:zinc ribbon domain-containing protein [Blastocatellia bacterium]